MREISRFDQVGKKGANVLRVHIYVCEAVFSDLQHIKSKNRSTLTQEHTNNLMRIAPSTFKPNFDDIVQNISLRRAVH